MTSWLSVAIRLIVVFTFLFGLPVVAIWGPPTWDPFEKWSLVEEPSASLNLWYGSRNAHNDNVTEQQPNSKKTTPPTPSKLANVSRLPNTLDEILPPPTHKRPVQQEGDISEVRENHFLTIQDRLRKLGARYYRLETWEDGQSFHFVCRVAEGESAKIYEAHGGDPLGTMEKVLKQVENWKKNH